MNIIHIAPNAPFNDGWGYQENLLPKYHAKLGHKVTLLVTNLTHTEKGLEETEIGKFVSVDGFEFERIEYKKCINGKITNFVSKMDVYDRLVQLKPEFIFYHGLVSTTIFDVIRYKKYCRRNGSDCIIVQDNHLDYNIGINPVNLKKKLMMMYYRSINAVSQQYVDKVYGVTPWREEYAREFFGISPSKTDVLIMGADDEKIDFENRDIIRESIRKQHGIAEDEFLVVSGGKIDEKKKIIQLMEACAGTDGVKLLVFGSVAEELKAEFQKMLDDNSNIVYVGWIDADKCYDYFFAANLVVFPGQHSVLWEQACAAKVPCVFAQWPGMDHVNNGGNAAFIENTDSFSIKNMIEKLCFTEKYCQMKEVAQSEATDVYLYSKIAEKSLSGIEKW